MFDHNGGTIEPGMIIIGTLTFERNNQPLDIDKMFWIEVIV